VRGELSRAAAQMGRARSPAKAAAARANGRLGGRPPRVPGGRAAFVEAIRFARLVRGVVGWAGGFVVLGGPPGGFRGPVRAQWPVRGEGAIRPADYGRVCAQIEALGATREPYRTRGRVRC